uniref:SPATA20 n=1 Tax=Macrostomum lignano TaxID=282301 RepID=A0A1I8HR49_9PLAT
MQFASWLRLLLRRTAPGASWCGLHPAGSRCIVMPTE